MRGLLDWWKRWSVTPNNSRMVKDDNPTHVIIAGAMGSGGEYLEGSSATAGPTLTGAVDSDITAMKTNTDSIRYGAGTQGLGFGTSVSSYVGLQQKNKRLFSTTLTATAGGEITAAAIGPPAIAGYQCCMCITHLWSDQTDGSIAMSITSTGGLDVGVASWTWATTANTVTDYSPGLFFQATDDNDTIDVSCAAGQAGANQVIEVIGYYWYET